MAGLTRRQLLHGSVIASIGVLAACQAPASTPAATPALAPTTAPAAKPTAPRGAAARTTRPQRAAAPQAMGDWTIAVGEDPDTLDPQKTAAAVTGTVYHYLGDSL